MKILAATFNEMQDRLRRYVQDRTAMIGAVAHDLRTPLTRLRFRVEGVPEPLRSKMTSDMEQMDAMIGATMSFVRDATSTAVRRRLELSSLVQSIADEMADTGADVHGRRNAGAGGDRGRSDRAPPPRLQPPRQRREVRRAGPCPGLCRGQDRGDRDRRQRPGPGHAADQDKGVLSPFYRGEPSRSRETGGAGLGLAVVRSVARAHGGDAALENLPGGGLRARARLPI